MLRVNRAGGAPGAKSQIHTHPGPEAFYVLAGKLGQRTPYGVTYAEAGTTMTGHGADTPIEMFSAGTTDLDELAIFVLDADRPFSSPAKFDRGEISRGGANVRSLSRFSARFTSRCSWPMAS
ncbi:hypothetical protein [Mesorhizobium sp. M0895]|uniref:hypothetical protein n=1 Tax=Mesorhizobium sp. M0895 TaxID=2957019 RepID=UPI00333BFE79